MKHILKFFTNLLWYAVTVATIIGLIVIGYTNYKVAQLLAPTPEQIQSEFVKAGIEYNAVNKNRDER